MSDQSSAHSERRDAPRHGLPDAYPFNESGFRADQADSARWVQFSGPTPQTVSVVFRSGAIYEIWPGGAIFNDAGTYIGHLLPTTERPSGSA